MRWQVVQLENIIRHFLALFASKYVIGLSTPSVKELQIRSLRIMEHISLVVEALALEETSHVWQYRQATGISVEGCRASKY